MRRLGALPTGGAFLGVSGGLEAMGLGDFGVASLGGSPGLEGGPVVLILGFCDLPAVEWPVANVDVDLVRLIFEVCLVLMDLLLTLLDEPSCLFCLSLLPLVAVFAFVVASSFGLPRGLKRKVLFDRTTIVARNPRAMNIKSKSSEIKYLDHQLQFSFVLRTQKASEKKMVDSMGAKNRTFLCM